MTEIYAVTTTRGREKLLIKVVYLLSYWCERCAEGSGWEHKIFERYLCGQGWLRIIEGGEEELCEHHVTELKK